MRLSKTSKILVALAAVAMVLVFAFYGGANPRQAGNGSSSHPEHVMATKLKANGVPNFGEVTPKLYRGALPNGEGIEELKKIGVDVVVDLRVGAGNDEETAVTKLGMRYVSIPWHCASPTDGTLAKFLGVIRENAGKKVFVHCQLGVDRTGMAVASYRMADEGWSADEAMKEMREFGFSSVHHMMCPGLAEYEEKFPERLKTSAAFKDLGIGTTAGKSK